MSASATPAPLLERSDALGALDAALAGARAGPDGRLLMLGGEAGVGKTSVVRAFCAEQSAGAFWGNCDALFTPRPLGPVLDLAESIGGELAATLEGEAQPHGVAGSMLRDLAEAAPAIVVLEDLHWADEATLDVVRLLARRVGRGVLVICTYRDDGLS